MNLRIWLWALLRLNPAMRRVTPWHTDNSCLRWRELRAGETDFRRCDVWTHWNN